MLERPDLLKALVVKHGARDTTARHSAMAELEAMQPQGSQFDPGHEIPEKSFFYRFVKKHFFNDFGAYENPVMPAGIDVGNSPSLPVVSIDR